MYDRPCLQFAVRAQLHNASRVLMGVKDAVLQGKNYETDVVAPAEASQSIDPQIVLEKLRQEVLVREEQAKIAADPEANLPPGWNVARVRPHCVLIKTLLL